MHQGLNPIGDPLQGLAKLVDGPVGGVSRNLFDRIEARPLTDEQRKAVVVDERRNLVVAAAGSGKTSVIVAKAGWLVRRRYRKPSELLLLAFARDARNEMEERIHTRLGAASARGVTVRTFHCLGMAIIGDAEGPGRRGRCRAPPPAEPSVRDYRTRFLTGQVRSRCCAVSA